MRLVVCGALAALLWSVPGLGTAQDRSVRLQLRVNEDLSELEGQLEVTFRNETSNPLRQLYFWLPFNQLRQPPPGMDQRNAHWIYPRSFASGGTEINLIRWQGEELSRGTLTFPDFSSPAAPQATGIEFLPTLPESSAGRGTPIVAVVALPNPLPPGEEGIIVLGFRTTVPQRFGRQGRARGVLTLAGGFYPQLAALGPEGWILDAPLADHGWDVELMVERSLRMVVNEHFFDVQHPGQVLRFSVAPAPYLALVASPRFRRFRVEAGGLTVELLSMSDRYRSPLPESGVGNSLLPADSGDATRWDYQGRLLDTVVRGVSLLEQLGVPLPPGEPVRLIEVPLRLELVSSVPAGILVSDRTYRITPWEAFFRMHDAQVLRALGWLSVASAVKRETRRDQGWIADLLAAATVDAALALGPGDRGPGLRELLRFGAFIPEIDQLLYSPLIQFRHLFLRPFREEDPLREEAWRLANNWPRGAVLHDKLVDLWDQERVQMLLQTYLATEQRLVPLVQSQAGEPMDWFFQQWLGPYPSVNYVVEEQRSEATETGFRHRVVVAREGAAIREPVEILVRYRGGSDEVFRWDGRGPRGVLEFDRAERIQQVVVDPRHRLVEDAQWADNHPRFDNVQPANWRPPVFNGLMVYWSAAENALYGTVDFSLKRQYDVRNSFRLAVDYAPRGLGAALGYYRGLGRLLDTNRASWVTGANLSVLRSFGTFADQEIPATSFGLSLSLSHDTRWYPYDPMEGWGVAMKAYGSGSVTDEGAWGWTVGTSGRVVGHYTPRVGHSFTGYAGAGAVFGEPLAEQLPSISDRAMLRAFEADETLGRVRLYGALEYRWTVVHDLDVNLAHLAWWRALFVALFVGGGTVSERDGLDGLFTASRLFSEVGVGVRTLLTILGAQPYIIAVDVALPITPRQRMRCVADVCAPRNPLGMYVSIQHTL